MNDDHVYHVGDLAEVVRPEDNGQWGWGNEMDEYIGKTVTIASVSDDGNWIHITEDRGMWSWGPEYFVPVEAESELPEIDAGAFLTLLGVNE